jgi:CDP-paratose 2-epimerase
MSEKPIVVTGGAGFVGSSLCLMLRRRYPRRTVIAFDNLRRRGSELNMRRVVDSGCVFVHGDVRQREDLARLGPVDWLIECSAEASVHAGYDDDPSYVVDTNLGGAINCLEHLRRHGGNLVFLSTSRLYPISGLRALPLQRADGRLEIAPGQSGPGWSESGIAEDFPLDGARSLYGGTKLSAELLIGEYAAMYGLTTIIDRCGVLTGPWQMGTVDQGFVALWLARHVFGGPLRYTGFGGEGLQVRDILHVDDLADLVALQMDEPARFRGRPFNVGGGRPVSVSLHELTEACRIVTGRSIAIDADPATRDADIPYYISDTGRLHQACGWQPARTVERILEDMHRWLTGNAEILKPVFAG